MRSNCGGSAAMAAQLGRSDGAQRWQRRWRHSDGDGGAATASAVQRQLWRRSDGNGDGGAAMGVAVVAVAADVHHPPLFACGCSSAAPDGNPPLFATDVRDVFCIFLLSLHIFNVGIPYTQTDDGHRTSV